MREIKFRAWNKEKKQFVNTKLFETWWYNDKGQASIPKDSEVQQKSELPEVMQFTGLLDKNGKEIYEEDIIICFIIYNKAEIEHQGIVKFEGGAFLVGSDTMTDSYMTFIELEGTWDLEVIGNIYENPKLLEEK